MDGFQPFPHDSRKMYAMAYEVDGVVLLMQALVPGKSDENPRAGSATLAGPCDGENPENRIEETPEDQVAAHRKISSALWKFSEKMESKLEALDAGEKFDWYGLESAKVDMTKAKETL